MLRRTALMATFLAIAATSHSTHHTYYVCDAGTTAYIGRYTIDSNRLHTYRNDDGKALFRHHGFWYMGDLTTWPPVTDYRCVLDCPHGSELPPVPATFTISNTGILPTPNLTLTPCLARTRLSDL